MGQEVRKKHGPIFVGTRSFQELLDANCGDLVQVAAGIDAKDFPVDDYYRRGPACVDWCCLWEELTADEAAARLVRPDIIFASLAAVLAWGAEHGLPRCPVVPLAQAPFAGRRERQVPRIDCVSDFFTLELVAASEKLARTTRFPVIHRS